MSERQLPAGLHLETLAVRAAVDKSQYGENSEALYLSSSFTQPDCETAARRNAFHVIDSTQLLSVTANPGDVKTIITHPASTSHGRLTEQQRLAAGIRQNLVRVAVGLEHLEDLKADLARGLDTL